MEVDEPLPTYEVESDCSFDLELPQSDSLFHEKKNLLEKKGFKTEERIHLKNSLDPEAITCTLENMLQIARIIKLDEVELYFLEDDGLPLEVYSPRNEVVALNFILQLVENSLCNCTELQKGDLQELRTSIIGKIGNIQVEDGIKSVIVEDQCCEKENCLLQWGEDNGVKTTLRIAYVEGAGRGTIAKEDLKVGDIALEIPISLLISEELVKTSDMNQILEKMSEISSETMLLLWSMKEKYNNDSKFKVYFDTLPEEFHTGLSCGIDALMALDGTMMFEEIMQAKQHLQAQYEELVLPLCTKHPDTFPVEMYTWEKFLWACELWYSNGMKIMFPDGELRTCLVPVAGFMNHSLYPHVMSYGKVDPTTNTLKFSLSRTCTAGEECLLSYGNFSSSHLFTFYGFLPKGDNPYDIIPLELDCLEDDYGEKSQVSNSTHMVRGTWFSHNHGIFHYGLPSRLLDYLRKAKSPMLRTKVHLQESLENEMEVLQQLRGNFDSVMDGLGDSDLDDRDNTGWDVKLAVEYKDTQRRIVSSILTSCYSGLRLVEDAWCKCIAEDIRG